MVHKVFMYCIKCAIYKIITMPLNIRMMAYCSRTFVVVFGLLQLIKLQKLPLGLTIVVFI